MASDGSVRAGDIADALVIGGGAFGLNAALALARTGRRVTLLDRAGPHETGMTASMGLVGALGPHQPSPWSALKALQLEALISFPAHAALLRDLGGLDAGWRATGRLQPLPDARARDKAEAQAAAAPGIWDAALSAMPAALREGAAAFGRQGGPRLRVLDASPQPGWIEAGAAGMLADDLGACIPPRAYCAALRAACAAAGAALRFHAPVAAVHDGGAILSTGEEIAARLTILAAGAESFALLGPGTGHAEKGQAAFYDIAPPPGAALVHLPGGGWIVPHDHGIAVGSTAEKTWETPGPDVLLEPVLEKAAALCPPLRGRAPSERWAGFRPKAAGKGPLLGPVSGDGRLWVATGGHKIGVALAHRVAALLVEALEHGPDALPPGLSPRGRIL